MRRAGLTDPQAREIVYGMPYKEWQAKYQKEATPGTKGRYDEIASRSLTPPPAPAIPARFPEQQEGRDGGKTG